MVSFKQFVVPVIILVIFASGGLAIYEVTDLAQDSAARDGGTFVENESHVQQVSMWQLTDNSTNQFTTGFNNTVSVYNNSSFELVRGTDYRWNKTDGSLYLRNTQNTTDGAPYTISYTYYQNTQDTQELAGPLGVLTKGIGRYALLAGGLGLIVFLLAFLTVFAKTLTNPGGPGSNR